MIQMLIALLSGTLFGAGLAVAEMTNPAKVIAFLDVAGDWDPSLAFVMGAGLLVSTIAVRFDRRPDAPAIGRPTLADFRAQVDSRLLIGASLFGAGWGLAGFCPGPALASMITGSGQVLLFVVSMVAGMLFFGLFDRRFNKVAEASQAPEIVT